MMEALRDSLKCIQCHDILDLPVILPCGDSICKKHITPEIKEYRCLACDVVHVIPSDKEGSFAENKALRQLLTSNLQQVRFSKEYDVAFEAFKNLNKTFEETRLFREKPSFFVNKTIGELKSEAEKMRQEYKLKIDERADKLVREIDQYENECKRQLCPGNSVSDELDKLTPEMDTVKQDMDKLEKILTNFTSTESELANVKEESFKLTSLLESRLAECKEKSLLNKLTHHKTKLASFSRFELQSKRQLAFFYLFDGLNLKYVLF
jgi:prefoldin subunit 5